MIIRTTFIGLFALLVATVAGAESVVETRHGFVVAKKTMEPESRVPAGAIIGGLVGLATAGGKSGSTKLKRTVGGAVVGGVIGGGIDRSRRYWVYTVRFPGGDEQRIAIQDDRLSLGDCAAVTYGTEETTVRYASDYFCRPEASRQAVEMDREREALSEPVATTERRDPCLEAKERLLDAEDEAEIERLIEKVRVICETGSGN